MIPAKLTCAPGSSAADVSTSPEKAISMPTTSNLVSFRFKNSDENKAISSGATAINNMLMPADTNFCAAKNEPNVKVVFKSPYIKRFFHSAPFGQNLFLPCKSNKGAKIKPVQIKRMLASNNASADSIPNLTTTEPEAQSTANNKPGKIFLYIAKAVKLCSFYEKLQGRFLFTFLKHPGNKITLFALFLFGRAN